ncbi:hypothetical protein FJZ36_02925 [Candidatus Poribacteria bacterium]|nr:hypothetical protein [Candidatus Poribacteria bacterium]
MAQWALGIAIAAFVLAAARWIADLIAGTVPFRPRRERHEGVHLRVELLASGTNCFIIRGGSTLLFVSLRVYNESPQRPATLSRIDMRLRHGRRWMVASPYPAAEADIFASLVRNGLPADVPPSSHLDFYEVYQVPDLMPQTSIPIRVTASDYTGSRGVTFDRLSLRLDTRPPLDILFQTLDI